MIDSVTLNDEIDEYRRARVTKLRRAIAQRGRATPQRVRVAIKDEKEPALLEDDWREPANLGHAPRLRAKRSSFDSMKRGILLAAVSEDDLRKTVFPGRSTEYRYHEAIAGLWASGHLKRDRHGDYRLTPIGAQAAACLA